MISSRLRVTVKAWLVVRYQRLDTWVILPAEVQQVIIRRVSMKNPDKIRELTDNFCILDAALAGFGYSFIAKQYKISSSRVSQIVYNRFKKINKRMDTPYMAGVGLTMTSLMKNKALIKRLLFEYHNGLNTPDSVKYLNNGCCPII